MPIYTYQCRNCDSRFDAKQSFSDDPLTECAVCGTEGTVFRIIQPAGIVFKGSGWYVTDSRRKNSANGKVTPINSKSENGNGAKGSNGSSDSATDSHTTTDTKAVGAAD